MTGTINANDFDLAATLRCGQAFRWEPTDDGWFVGVVGSRVWRLRQVADRLEWQDQSLGGRDDPNLSRYLSLDRSLPGIINTFPDDPYLAAAVKAHPGLRVLRQDPWETLASFIASSTKQIVQIRQIVAELARRFGDRIETGWGVFHMFPAADRVARCSHRELWDCKLGFRARNLLAAAQAVDSGRVQLADLSEMDLDAALEHLCALRGVGEKIALCTLLFSCGQDRAFPVDVWVRRALQRLYFPRHRVSARELRSFTREYFGPHAGWAQQYLFHNERQEIGRGPGTKSR